MELEFSLHALSYWQHSQTPSPASSDSTELDKKGWPKLEWVSAMQRRRLSPFMKMAMYCAHHSSTDYEGELATVFSSRHGDLQQTSTLLSDLAGSEQLSPTAFSLSVHNAVAGLYSILSHNKAPSTTIAAGKDTFFMAIVDAVIRARTSDAAVLLVHAEQTVPQTYQAFYDEQQVSHAIAFVIDPHKPDNLRLRGTANQTCDEALPAGVAFAASAQQSSIHPDDGSYAGWAWQSIS